MKKTNKTNLLSLFLCVVLIAAMALLTTACDNFNFDFLGTEQEAATNTPNTNGADNSGEAPIAKKQFTFVVVDGNGNETTFQISTDKNITADYDVDKSYWAFYINGEYAFTGVDSTPIEEGATYTLKVEK